MLQRTRINRVRYQPSASTYVMQAPLLLAPLSAGRPGHCAGLAVHHAGHHCHRVCGRRRRARHRGHDRCEEGGRRGAACLRMCVYVCVCARARLRGRRVHVCLGTLEACPQQHMCVQERAPVSVCGVFPCTPTGWTPIAARSAFLMRLPWEPVKEPAMLVSRCCKERLP